jgi:hypothetical protein
VDAPRAATTRRNIKMSEDDASIKKIASHEADLLAIYKDVYSVLKCGSLD